MSAWFAVLIAAAAVYGLKVAGYLAPGSWLRRPEVARVAALLTAGLLAALVAVQTFGRGERLVLDSRAVALAVAAVLLWRRAPFLVVVVVGAVTAASLRALGLP